VAAIAIVVAIGIALRFAIRSDLWLDEALSVNIAHLPAGRIAPWLKHDGAPPLYYFLLHYWTALFGTSDVATRALSGVFSVAALPVAWCCARRAGGRALAWIALLVLVSSPYAITYATSARMYSLEMLLVFAGILAVRRVLDDPSWPRLALVAVVTALLVYTQYWAFYLVLAVALYLVVMGRRPGPARAVAVRLLVAIGVGVATFLPWLPTFLYQAKHTGTPWGQPLLPPIPIGLTFQDFAGGPVYEGWMLFFAVIALVLLGVFGARADARHIELDLRTQPGVRAEAVIGAATLVIGTSLAWASGSAFQSRYAAIMFPFFVIVVARGVTLFADPTVRTCALALVVGLGLAGGVRNASTNRSEAGEVARVLRAEAKPGDVVLYCPDQLGPAVHRLVQPGLDEVTYPVLRRPALVDWVDYTAVIARHPPAAVAKEVLTRAGGHAIWFVSAPGYRTHTTACPGLQASLARVRPDLPRLASNDSFYEMPGLDEFPAH
jgi:uncharacterized membrane protein